MREALPRPSTPVVCAAFAALLLADASAVAADGANPDGVSVMTEWTFTALLDGTPIGSHRFVLERDRDGTYRRTLTSDARFDVRLLGLTVYRYRHRASEQWNGDCLASLVAETDDDDKRTLVRGFRASNAFAIEVSVPPGEGRKVDAPACTMSFAYWNPALTERRQLLDPGSGRLEAVAFTPLPAEAIDVKGIPTLARGWRITGLKQPIDIWYVGERWIGLDTRIGNRQLAYRLQ